MNIEPLIRYINRYIDLTPEEVEIISTNINIRKYLKGQYVVQQGDVCKNESFVVKGCLKTFYIDKEGQEHIVMFAIENWWVGDLGSFITQSPAHYNVQCLENSELIQFSFEVLEQLYERVPKMERFFRIILQNAFVAAEKRVVANFSLTAKERYLSFKAQFPEIEQRVPQYMVASYLGITKEFLSKIRNQLLSE